MVQFYLFRRILSGAVLSVPKHFERRSSIYSGAYSMKQFYLFRSTMNGAILFVPLISYSNCSKCSLPICYILYVVLSVENINWRTKYWHLPEPDWSELEKSGRFWPDSSSKTEVLYNNNDIGYLIGGRHFNQVRLTKNSGFESKYFVFSIWF